MAEDYDGQKVKREGCGRAHQSIDPPGKRYRKLVFTLDVVQTLKQLRQHI